MTNDPTGEVVIVSAQVRRDVLDRLDAAAQASDRSRSAELRVAIREHLARADNEEEPHG